MISLFLYLLKCSSLHHLDLLRLGPDFIFGVDVVVALVTRRKHSLIPASVCDVVLSVRFSSLGFGEACIVDGVGDASCTAKTRLEDEGVGDGIGVFADVVRHVWVGDFVSLLLLVVRSRSRWFREKHFELVEQFCALFAHKVEELAARLLKTLVDLGTIQLFVGIVRNQPISAERVDAFGACKLGHLVFLLILLLIVTTIVITIIKNRFEVAGSLRTRLERIQK
jgi:hypothetical protein